LITPKAFANFSPGLERSSTLGTQKNKSETTLKGLGMCAANPFRVKRFFYGATPWFFAAPNPGLKLANAFGVWT
jgi:hypothetical protein